MHATVTQSQRSGSFDASALALRTASANSAMARGSRSWIEDYQEPGGKMGHENCTTPERSSLAAGFTASSLDAIQVKARSLASNVVARWNVWLRHWEVDQGSQSRLSAWTNP